jgi:hypothetical protein
MFSSFRVPRQIAAIAVVTLVAVTAAVAMGLSNPEPVSSGALGPDWQCTRLAFVFTSCTRVVRFKTAAAEGKVRACPKSWRNGLGLLRW